MGSQKHNSKKNEDSSHKHARGSKKVHSPTDNSTKDGFEQQPVNEEEE